MAARKKTWVEKMNPSAKFHVETCDKQFADIPAGATMLIATPTIVEHYIRNIPEGHAGSLAQMRKDLAADYNAQYMCPITAGIFLRIVSEAAWEQLQQGKAIDDVVPFWRMIDRKTPTAKKLSFGTDFVQQQRLAEGLSY